jgi:TonB-dependent starch-binding outer membrane protein SusC
MSRVTCWSAARVFLFLLISTVVLAPGLAAQTGTVTGRVTDERSGNPLAAAQVFIGELARGVLTQQNGSYTMTGLPPGTYTVTVQRLGYRPASGSVTVSEAEPSVLNFAITETALQLDEIIVTGTPGGTQRRAIGNTVQRMNAASITETVAVSNFQDLLGARTPGLRFSVNNGNLGTGSQMTLRGVGSFNTGRNQPLIFVDGVRVNNNSQAGPIIGQGQEVNVLNDFNPDEIESVEIIKGPAAASLYGTEASAGVIQIITKRGAEGAAQFSLTVRQGVNYMSDPAGRLGTYYTCPTNPSPGLTPAGHGCRTADELVPYNMYDEATRYIREGYFDWETPHLFSYGHSQAYNLDVTGGTSAIRYFFSVNRTDDVGIVKYNTQDNLRFRGNVNLLLSENFTVDVLSSYGNGKTRFDQATVADGAIWQDLAWSNGYYLDRITPFGSNGNCEVSACRPNVRLGGFQEHLPTDVRDMTFATRDFSRFTGSGTLNYNLSDINLGRLGTGALSQRLILGLDKGWDIDVNFFPLETGVPPEHLQQYTDTWASVYTETDNGEMRYSRPISTNYSADYAVTAKLLANEVWSFDTSFGVQYYVAEHDVFTNLGQGFASPLSQTINQIAQSNITTQYQNVEDKSLGFFVQQQVGWNDRLFLTGALRFDDSSTFGTDAPAQRYPKFSGTWVISEESFWRLDAINSLRIRSAWGKAGRQPSAIAGFNIYTATRGPGGAPAIRAQSPGNPGIQPEVSTEIEVGLDYALFDDRVSGEFTYYTRKNEGALLALSTLSSSGFPGSVDQNVGRIDNWGWEASLNTRLIQSNRFSFGIDFSADFNDNEIIALGDYPGTAGIRAGLPYPYLVQYDWVVDAEFMEAGDPRRHATTNVFGQRIYATCDSGISLAPDPSDPAQFARYGIQPGGPAVPCTEVTRGLNLFAGRAFAPYAFSVAPRAGLLNGRLQVFALAEGQYGMYRNDNLHAWGHIYNGSKVSRVQDDPWWVAMRNLNATRASLEKSTYKADFWKLREVGAMFTLPTSLAQRARASRASVSVSARNVWTMWQATKEIYGMPVVDPEYGNSTNLTGDGNFYAAPALSNVTATLRVTF